MTSHTSCTELFTLISDKKQDFDWRVLLAFWQFGKGSLLATLYSVYRGVCISPQSTLT